MDGRDEVFSLLKGWSLCKECKVDEQKRGSGGMNVPSIYMYNSHN